MVYAYLLYVYILEYVMIIEDYQLMIILKQSVNQKSNGTYCAVRYNYLRLSNYKPMPPC